MKKRALFRSNGNIAQTKAILRASKSKSFLSSFTFLYVGIILNAHLAAMFIPLSRYATKMSYGLVLAQQKARNAYEVEQTGKGKAASEDKDHSDHHERESRGVERKERYERLRQESEYWRKEQNDERVAAYIKHKSAHADMAEDKEEQTDNEPHYSHSGRRGTVEVVAVEAEQRKRHKGERSL